LLGSLLDPVTESRLLLLTDGPLNSVPFAALPLPGRESELLVDRFVMASAPSMALAMSHPARERTRSTRIAVVSDPVYAPDDRRLTLAMRDEGTNLRGPAAPSPNNLTRLPYSALEASAVTKAFGADTTIQLAVPDHLRGRVMSVYTTVFSASVPIGGLAMGAIASGLGAAFAIGLGGVLSVAVGLGALAWGRRGAFNLPTAPSVGPGPAAVKQPFSRPIFTGCTPVMPRRPA